MIPYLGIDNKKGFKWKINGNIRNDAIQKPHWLKIQKIPEGETVTNYIRHTKNILSIWTDKKNLYEINSNVNKINIESSITPSYMNGKYLGWKENKIQIVNRSNSLEEAPCKLKITNIVGIMYTHDVILNTANGCYRSSIENLDNTIPLANTFTLHCIDDDKIGLYDGKLSILKKWKVTCTIRTGKIFCCKFNDTEVVTINDKNAIKAYDCETGVQKFSIDTAWHFPSYIGIDRNIYSIDKDILAIWTLSPMKVSSWKPMSIRPDLFLLATIPLGNASPVVSFCQSFLSIQIENYIHTLSLYLDTQTFMSPVRTLRWVMLPTNDVTINLPLLKETIGMWSKNIFDNIVEYQLHCNYSLRKIFKKDPDLKNDFDFLLNDYVKQNCKKFQNREFVHYFVTFATSMSFEIDIATIPTPNESADFYLWIETNTYSYDCVRKALKVNQIEYLYTIQDQIIDWSDVLNHTPLEYLTIRNILRSCKDGYASKWINIFKSLTKFDNIRNAWEAVYRYVLDVKVLNSHSYPNNSDGKWQVRHLVMPNTWVVVDEVVRNTNSLKDLKPPLLTWVANKESPCNVTERALELLDEDYWDQKGSKWISYNGEILKSCTCVQTSRGQADVLDWPKLIYCDGTIGDEIPLSYKVIHFDFYIDSQVRKNAIKYIREQVSNGKMLDVSSCYRKTMLTLLNEPMMLQAICYNGSVTCIASGFNNVLWVGEKEGSISFVREQKTQRVYAHDYPVRSIDFFEMLGISTDSMGYICLWDKTSLRNKIKSPNPIKKVKIIDENNVWFIDCYQSLWHWNTVGNPTQFYESGISDVCCIDSYDNYVATLTDSLNIWFKSSYSPLQESNENHITCINMISEEDLVYGTKYGSVYLASSIDGEKIKLWQKKNETCTALLCTDIRCFVGTKSGTVYTVPLELEECAVNKWYLNSPILQMSSNSCFIFVLTEDGKLFKINYNDFDVKTSFETLHNIVKEWPSISHHVVQDSIIAMNNACERANYAKIINFCIQDVEQRKFWCTSEILEVLVSSMRYYPGSLDTIRKLFCHTNHAFTCTICFSKTVNEENPISLITKCGHRFHTKCLKSLVQKNDEWDTVCRNEWALTVTLNCPICRTEFVPKDTLVDYMMTDMCLYESDTEV